MGLNGQFNARLQNIEKWIKSITVWIINSVEKLPWNLTNGSASGSIRGVDSAPEDDDYTIGEQSLSLGEGTKASGTGSMAIGGHSVASGGCSFAGGQYAGDTHTTASGDSSIAYGLITSATGKASAAFNQKTIASGNSSTAIGFSTVASGSLSFASGQRSEASGTASIAVGDTTIAKNRSQIALGKFNESDPSSAAKTEIGNYVVIIGNGSSDSNRSNALTIDWVGNIVCNNIPAPPTNNGSYMLTCTVNNGVVTYTWGPPLS